MVVASANGGEITGHLGDDDGDPVVHGNGYFRNGTRRQAVITVVGPVAMAVLRDRDRVSSRKLLRA